MEKQQKENQKKLLFKIGFILLLILLLMIPNYTIQDLILERKAQEYEVQSQIASSWGPDQKLIGPILSIPYEHEFETDSGTKIIAKQLRVLPQALDIKVDISTQERKKSIYKTILYNADHQLSGHFKMPSAIDFGENVKTIHWDKAKVDIGFSSAASLDNIVDITLGSNKYKMDSGASDAKLFNSAIHASNIVLDAEIKKVDFSTNIGINGSGSLKYLPIADNTTVTMQSTWSAPGFVGLPLPQNRKITENGFTAKWKSTEYNRPFKSMWDDNLVHLERQNVQFGVDLVQTVGHYQKNMRSAKYALLIISMSFLVFFFFETLKGNKIHPVQYIFIGLSLSIFYILLLSLSEHVGFDKAYTIAASSVVGLISWYSKFILEKTSNVVILSTILGGLYLYIYILLQMEEFALLVGSIGLFIALATTMYLSRNMNWYGTSTQKPISKIVNDEAAFV